MESTSCNQSNCISMTSNYSKFSNLLLSPFTSIKSSTPVKSRRISRVVTPLRRSILRSHSCSCTNNPFSPGIYDGSFGLHLNGNDFSPRMFEYKPEDGGNENSFAWNIDQMSKLHPISISEESVCCHGSPNITRHLELREKVVKYFQENHHIPSPDTSRCLGHSKELAKTPLTSKRLRTPKTSITLSSSRSICIYRSLSESSTGNTSQSLDSDKKTPKLSEKILEMIQSPSFIGSQKPPEENGNSSDMFVYFPDEDPEYDKEVPLSDEGYYIPVIKAGEFLETDDSFLQLEEGENDYSHQKVDFDISSIEYDSFRLDLMMSPIPSNSESELNSPSAL
uniref:Protein aurora borealis n=1 Tax=Strongyloides venezuelensis TaxID=75913 RepID=A0A0K0G0J6_STRVS